MRAIVMVCILGTALAQYAWNGPGKDPDNSTSNACLFDTGSCSCCLMQRKLYKLSMHINNTLDDLQSNLTKIQTSFNHMRTSQFAFSTALTDIRVCVGPYRVDTVVMYRQVLSNLGNVYQPSTGVFTAPRAGVYFFSLTAFSDAGSPAAALAACVRLMRNGVAEVSLSERNNEDQEDSASTSLLLSLRAGDNVYVQLPVGCFLCDDSNHFNTFTGYLVYATE